MGAACGMYGEEESWLGNLKEDRLRQDDNIEVDVKINWMERCGLDSSSSG